MERERRGGVGTLKFLSFRTILPVIAKNSLSRRCHMGWCLLHRLAVQFGQVWRETAMSIVERMKDNKFIGFLKLLTNLTSF